MKLFLFISFVFVGLFLWFTFSTDELSKQEEKEQKERRDSLIRTNERIKAKQKFINSLIPISRTDNWQN